MGKRGPKVNGPFKIWPNCTNGLGKYRMADKRRKVTLPKKLRKLPESKE